MNLSKNKTYLRFLFYMGFNILLLLNLNYINNDIGLNDGTILIIYFNQLLIFFELVISKKEVLKNDL